MNRLLRGILAEITGPITAVHRWACRHPRLFALVVVVLVLYVTGWILTPPAHAVGGGGDATQDAYGDHLISSDGIRASHYSALFINRGDAFSTDKTIWSLLVDIVWGGAHFWLVTTAIDTFTWLLGFSWVDIIAVPIQSLATAAVKIIDQFGIVPLRALPLWPARGPAPPTWQVREGRCRDAHRRGHLRRRRRLPRSPRCSGSPPTVDRSRPRGTPAPSSPPRSSAAMATCATSTPPRIPSARRSSRPSSTSSSSTRPRRSPSVTSSPGGTAPPPSTTPYETSTPSNATPTRSATPLAPATPTHGLGRTTRTSRTFQAPRAY